jgi:PAS domain S-box-containing protein
MAAGKKKPEERNTETSGSERSLRDGAEEQLAHSPKHSPELKGKTSEQFIYELQVHQIELETQAEELRRAHLALEEARDKYLDLYDFAPTGYLTLTDNALIAEVNLAGATLLGVERSKLVNVRFRKFIVPEFFEPWDQYFTNVLNQEEKQCCTLTLKRSDGSTIPARLEGIRLTGSDEVTTVRIAISDITDIWQIEALKNEYSILNGILESTDAAVFSLDRKYRYTSFNSHHAMVMKQLYGADIEPGHSIFDYQSVKEDQVRAKHNIDRALAGEHVMEEAFSGEEG